MREAVCPPTRARHRTRGWTDADMSAGFSARLQRRGLTASDVQITATSARTVGCYPQRIAGICNVRGPALRFRLTINTAAEQFEQKT